MLNNEFIDWSQTQTGLDLFKDFCNEKYYQDHGDLNERDLIEAIGFETVLLSQAFSNLQQNIDAIEKALMHLGSDYTPPKEGPKPPKGKKA